ncbi:hypothetical protein RhiJN_27243 [Ceratobasidium sp. AG-Ba]|nr:hypothetical protein RhiJN_27243 [Ceratobasidium sp. AG-Ba]QRW13722.1 hypothetical protein RhiLY_12721 [Ceratobasidium sp. AG-Ba]
MLSSTMLSSIPGGKPCSIFHCAFDPNSKFHALWTSCDAGWVLGASTEDNHAILTLMDGDNFSSHVVIDTGCIAMTCAIWVSETVVLLGFSDGRIWLGVINRDEDLIEFKMTLDDVRPSTAQFNSLCGNIELSVAYEATAPGNAAYHLFNSSVDE